MSTKKLLYRISFISNNKIYEMYVKTVSQSNLFGFIEIGDFVFNKNTTLVVDPSEENLKTEFAGVKSSFIPMHAILRIDQVQEQGTAKITSLSGKENNISQFPNPIYTPPKG